MNRPRWRVVLTALVFLGAAAITGAAAAVLVATPAQAIVDVADVHGDYDGCIAKFTAAGKRDLVDRLDKSGHKFKVRKTDDAPHGSASEPSDRGDAANGKGTGGQTNWNPGDDGKPFAYDPGVSEDKCATLYHEMAHLADYDKGTNQQGTCRYLVGGVEVDSHIAAKEVNAFRKENEYRRAVGLPERTKAGPFLPLPPADVTCLPDPPRRTSTGCSVGCAIGSGDPHLRTFDGLNYDFQAVGEFILTRAPGLQVQARMRPLAGLRTISMISSVGADVAGDRVSFTRTPSGMALRVGGAPTPGPAAKLTLPHGGTVAPAGDQWVEVRWPDGSALQVRPGGITALSVTMQPAPARSGTVEGLFGNFDGKPAGDLVVRGGATLPAEPGFKDFYPAFADSWRITQEQSLLDYDPGQSTATFTDRTFPDRLVTAAQLPNRATAEAICRQAGVTEPAALEACILDVGLTGDAAFAADALRRQEFVAAAGATTLSVTQPGGSARLTFNGTSGQKVFVDVVSSNLPDRCGIVTLSRAGTFVANGCIIGGRGYIDGTVLPVTGQYTVELTPGGQLTGSAAVRVITAVDQVAALAADGPPVTTTLTQPGAVARLSFPATAGEKVFVDVTSASLADQCGLLTLLDPAQKYVAGGCVIGGTGFIDGSLLTTPGQYTILIDPGDRRTGSATVRVTLAHDQDLTLTLNGPAAAVTVGQAGAVTRLRFTGSAGQKVRVDVPVSTLRDQCGLLTLLDPAGRYLAGGCVIGGQGSISSTPLPAGGVYTILVDPADRVTGTAQVRLLPG